MGPNSVLACLTTEPGSSTLLKAAGALARRTSAHVIGLHTLEAIPIYPGLAVHMSGPVFEEFNLAQKAQADAIHAQFQSFAAAENLATEWRLLKAQASSVAERMIESAMAADVVLMAQENPTQDRPDQHGVQESVIRRSGRPVIVVPTGWETETLGETLLIGWSATRESARAAHDAIAVAAPGATIHILVAGSDPGERDREIETARDLAATFDRRGFEVNLIAERTPYRSVAAALQDAAEEHGADLIATGAFGHSRIYDFVLGAVTTELMADMRRPVLFSK